MSKIKQIIITINFNHSSFQSIFSIKCKYIINKFSCNEIIFTFFSKKKKFFPLSIFFLLEKNFQSLAICFTLSMLNKKKRKNLWSNQFRNELLLNYSSILFYESCNLYKLSGFILFREQYIFFTFYFF